MQGGSRSLPPVSSSVGPAAWTLSELWIQLSPGSPLALHPLPFRSNVSREQLARNKMQCLPVLHENVSMDQKLSSDYRVCDPGLG